MTLFGDRISQILDEPDEADPPPSVIGMCRVVQMIEVWQTIDGVRRRQFYTLDGELRAEAVIDMKLSSTENHQPKSRGIRTA